MGLEADCLARVDGRESAGKARLEEKHLVFRGDFRLNVPLASVTRADAQAGVLHVEWSGRKAALGLGAAAEKWATRIRSPLALLDKLGVKAGMQVLLLRVPVTGLAAEVEARGADVSGRQRKGSDLVIAYFESQAQLARLREVAASLQPGGALWAVWRKGRRELREDDIRAAALPLGLVDVKVASVSETLSGLKLMWRRSRR